MRTSNRLCGVAFVAGWSLFVSDATIGHAQKDSHGRPSSLTAVEEKARAAQSGTSDSVRQLVDEVFRGASLMRTPAASVKDRLVRSELTYRNGGLGVSQRDLTNAFNEVVTTYGLPDGLQTTPAQMHLFRNTIRQYVPSVAGLHSRRYEGTAEMSPVEASLIVMSLAFQKMSNPDYQISADEWVQQTLKRKGSMSRSSPNSHKPESITRRVVVVLGSRSLKEVREALASGSADESGEIVEGAHEFMDRLGFRR